MKNKIQKILVIMMVVIAMGTSNSYADTYALRGALIGAGTGAVLGMTIAIPGVMEEDFCNDPGTPVSCNIILGAEAGLIGAGIGGLIGLGIGALIPKNPKFTVSPTFNPTPGAVGGGVNLSVRF